MKHLTHLFILLALSIASCKPEEIPLPPHQEGALSSVEIKLGSDYSNQLYFNLEESVIIRQNVKDEWDLGLENGENGWHILLNSALYNSVAYVHSSNIDITLDYDTLDFKYDNESGNLDSTAFGDYRSTLGFFVVNMGNTTSGSSRGFCRMRITQVTSTDYTIEIASSPFGKDGIFIIPKEDNTNFTTWSLSEGKAVDIEPNKEDWDLWFTGYTFIFHDPPLPYSVTGALLNPAGTTAIEVDSKWEDVNWDYAQSLNYSSERDIIGYDWKEYNFDTGLYEVDASRIFVIHSVSGKYFKLRFIDFYDEFGEKGNLQFELVEL